MGLTEHDKCLFCKDNIETIDHIYLDCKNVKQLWYETENWIKTIHDCHFKLADVMKIFGTQDKDQIKHLILISMKDELYAKRKTGKKMELGNFKKYLLKNLNITRLHELTASDVESFDQWWNIFFRTDPVPSNSWYML